MVGVAGLLVVALAVTDREDLRGAVEALRSARPAFVASLAVLFIAGLAVQVALQRSGQRLTGSPMGWREAVAPSLGAVFANLVAKSGGMAGVTLFVGRARRRGRPVPPVVAGYLVVVVLNQLALALVVAVALLTLALEGRFSSGDALAAVLFAAYLLLVGGAVLAAFRSRSVVRRLYALPARIGARLRRRPAVAHDDTAADELYDALAVVRRGARRVVPTFGLALAVDVVGVVEVYAAVAAVSGRATITTALLGYGIGTLFGIVGFVPGGLGFVEVSLGAVLTASGLPVAIAAAAVALYRLAEIWLPVVVGAVAAHVATRSSARGRIPRIA